MCPQVGLANVGKSTLFQAITKCSLGNPAVREHEPSDLQT
jgi:ribosome-binding ATPase YchF (GTP1/OBG family)